MFASQLLRILQTIPSDVKYDNRVFDISEQETTMKEKQHATFDAKSFGREADPMALESKEIYHVNGSERIVNPLAYEIKGGDESWNPFLDDYSMDNEIRNRDSPGKENQNGVLNYGKDADLLSSNTNDKDEMREHEISTKLGEFTHCYENEYRNSSLPHVSASDMGETDMNSYTDRTMLDKNVLEYELPEVEVCYKEINYHIVKDICVDEGMPEKDRKNLIESSQDDQSDLSFPELSEEDNHCAATRGGVHMEFVVSDGSTEILLENNKGANEDEYGSKEESQGNLIAQGGPKSLAETSLDKDDEFGGKEEGHGNLIAQGSPGLPPEMLFDNDTVESVNPEDSVQQIDETNNSATDKASEEESFVDRKLPMQEFGTRSFLRSFMSSFDSEDATMPYQIPVEKPLSEGPAAALTVAESKEDAKTTSLVYNSKNVESGAITFNFNSPAPVVDDGITTERVEDAKEPVVDSRTVHDDRDPNPDVHDDRDPNPDIHDDEDPNPDNLSSAMEVQCTISNENCTGNPQEQSLNVKDENSNGSSATDQIQCISSNDGNHENVQEPQIDSNSDDPSPEAQVQFPTTKIENSPNNDGKTVETKIFKHKRRNSSNVSDFSQLQRDEGESSFSAAGLITYSGQIAYSGSLSVRSDGSTASGKSFAFPILQDEWNSSPVRMKKADRRHIRKHKCWRSGFLCCRF